MIKMDMIWIAVATLLYPATSPKTMVTRRQIENKVDNLFGDNIMPVMIERHLVSWVDRQADKAQPSRGGSRNRYLFRTIDGTSPSEMGDFRLYKQMDNQYDGWDKTGRTCPDPTSIPVEYHYLIDWYKTDYYPASQ
jgi:hypothetical protein